MGYLGNAPYQGSQISGGSIQDGTIQTADLADASVTTAKIVDAKKRKNFFMVNVLFGEFIFSTKQIYKFKLNSKLRFCNS